MIAYFADVPTLFFATITHRMGMNHDKDAVLFIDDRVYKSKELGFLADELKRQGIFSNVISCGLFAPNDLSTDTEGNVTADGLTEYFDKVFQEAEIDINSFEQIYVTNDSWEGYVNIYFNIKKIQYIWIQIDENRYPNIKKDDLKKYVTLFKKYKALTPWAEYAEGCILSTSDISIKEMDEHGKKYTLWNKEECFNNITPQDMQRIFDCFHLDDVINKEQSDTSKGTLIVKNSNTFLMWRLLQGLEDNEYIKDALGIARFEQKDLFFVMDKISLDFFAPKENRIFVKGHIHAPVSEEEVLAEYGTNAVTVPNVPFEILIKYFTANKLKFDVIIGTVSTSLELLTCENYNKFFHLGLDFARTWWFYIGIYSALLFAREQNYKQICCSEFLKSQIELLSSTMHYRPEVALFNASDIKSLRNAFIVIDTCRQPINFSLNGLHVSNAAALLNCELTMDFFVDPPKGIVPILIKKSKEKELKCDILARDEFVWIYSKNMDIRDAARKFTFKRDFYNLGIKAYVEETTYPQQAELIQARRTIEENSILKLQVGQLQSQVDQLCRKIDLLTKHITDPEAITNLLKNTVDIDKYFEILEFIKSRYLIILSIRDTPGSALAEETVDKICDFGFTKFSKELWRMYVGVCFKGVTICDITGEHREVPVEYKCENPLMGLNVCVSSKAWRKGNKTEVIINNEDCAVNIRGINLVVYDVENKCLIDSIAYDAQYKQSKRFERKSM